MSRTDAEIDGMIMRSLLIGAVVLVAALLLVAFVIEVAVRQIRAMTEAADSIAAGDLSQRIGLKGKGEIARLAGSFDKMTENLSASRKELVQANEELRRWSEKLEREVENRTQELKESNRDLEMAIAVKEDFLRAVSHDLNGPLVNISGMCGMILRKYGDQLDEGVKDRLSRIQRNVGRLTDLIGDLLELSRIKSRRLPFTWVEISDLINEVWGLFEFQVEQKGFALYIPDSLPSLYVEKSRIKQIFHNLFDNAIKYVGDRKDPEIRVSHREDAQHHHFSVEDNGPGISPEDRKILFHVFRRGKSAEVRKSPGRGVGLSLVKQIVQTYGGEIAVESEPGKGATFHFSLLKSACSEDGADGAKEDENPSRG
jgi:signal transduction histidine kinase